MLKRIYKLLLNEVAKQAHTKIPYVGIICMLLASSVLVKSIKFAAGEMEITGFAFFITSMLGACTSTVPLFGTIFASIIVASESTRGTIRVALTRPIRRIEFLIAKWLTAFIYLLALLMIVIVFFAIYGQIVYGFENVTEEEFVIFSKSEVFIALLKSLIFLMFPMMATVTFGFCISVLSKNVAAAVGSAVGILFTVEPIKHLLKFKSFNMSKYIFTSYHDLPLVMTSDVASGIGNPWKGDLSEIAMLVVVCSSYIIVGWILSLAVFLKRDLN